jgi:hypothetical protein
VPVGIDHTTQSEEWAEVSEDLEGWQSGQHIELWAYVERTNQQDVQVRRFTVFVDRPTDNASVDRLFPTPPSGQDSPPPHSSAVSVGGIIRTSTYNNPRKDIREGIHQDFGAGNFPFARWDIGFGIEADPDWSYQLGIVIGRGGLSE